MQWNRRTGSVALVVCVVLYTVLTQSSFGGNDASCGLGLPPDAPGFAEAQAREEAEVQRSGFRRVCAANLNRFAISFEPLDMATSGLAFEPVDVTRTPFAGFESLGGKAEAVNRTKSRLYRGFRMPGGHTLTLFEHDLSADGARLWRDPKDEPERVNGQPARLSVLETNTGKAVSLLSWVEGRRGYELWIDANVARLPIREQLFNLAASLPASIPACPNEPPPKPVRLDANGRPVFEPFPDEITEEDEARFKSEQPCKR